MVPFSQHFKLFTPLFFVCMIFEEKDVIFILSSKIRCFPPPWLLSGLFLSLIFCSLKMTCLDVVFLTLTFLGILWASWIQVWCLMLRKFCCYCFKYFFCFYSLSLSWDSHYAYVIPFVAVPQPFNILLCFFFSVFVLFAL